MQNIKLKSKTIDYIDDVKHTCFDVNFAYTLATGDTITVTEINVFEESYEADVYTSVSTIYEFTNNASAIVHELYYNDRGLIDAISKFLQMDIEYSEQGMQDYGYAHFDA